MTLSTQPLPTLGQPNGTEDAKIRGLLSELQGIVNGNIDAANLSPTAGITAAQLASALNTALGVNDSSARRGKSIVAAAETRTNTAYGLLTTPDRVQSIVLPTDGLICVAYQATWQESVSGAARAALFLGANQVRVASSEVNGPVTVAAATAGANPNTDQVLATSRVGLMSSGLLTYTGDLTTGQVVGMVDGTSSGSAPGHELNGTVKYIGFGPGPNWVSVLPGASHLAIFAAAGTYDVSVQFKATSGSVTAKNRKLWVWTMGF